MGFAEPLAFLFAGLYGVLVLLYLWERWRRRVTVPALFLWRLVHEDPLRVRRFRPDLLFLLQALLLACLITGLAQPYLHRALRAPWRGRHILVLDTTASMQAREDRTTRFDQARSQALAELDRLGSEDEVMLITAGNRPEIQVPFTRDHDILARALKESAPTDTGGDLSLALAFADTARRRSDIPTGIDVFTDLAPGSFRLDGPQPPRVFQVGETDDNLAIEALQIFQGRFQEPRRATAYILVRNFSHRDAHGFLTVRLESAVVHRTGFTLGPRDSKGFLFRDFPGPGRVEAHLEIDDALAADNSAWAWIRPVTPVKLLLVSASSALARDLRNLAEATRSLQVTVLPPEAFTNDQAAAFDAVIFNDTAPPAPVLVNALYVFPPDGNHIFPVSGTATGIEVLDWNARHSILQGLRPLAAVPLQRARIITAPPWSETLLWSRTNEREFPLAFAGELDGRRVACITIDLDAERLLSSDNVNLALFFMNLLSWLTPEPQDVRVVATGQTQSFGALPAGTVRLRDPHGAVRPLPSTDTAFEPLQAGEYQLQVDGTQRSVLANFIDPAESDIGRISREGAPLVAVVPTPNAAASILVPPADSPYRRGLYLAAVLLLLLETVVARRGTV